MHILFGNAEETRQRWCPGGGGRAATAALKLWSPRGTEKLNRPCENQSRAESYLPPKQNKKRKQKAFGIEDVMNDYDLLPLL